MTEERLPRTYDPTRPEMDPDDMQGSEFYVDANHRMDPNRTAEFHVGQCYEKEPAKPIACVKCNGVEFHVAQGSYFTAIRCPNCKWEYCIHDG